MTTEPEPLKPLKTWSHLAARRKRPTEYEVVTTNLHYHQMNPECPWELDPNLHMNDWYRKYCNNSPLKHDDWDSFRDPDQIVYRTYNLLQDGQETYIYSLFEQFNKREHDVALDKDWVKVLSHLYTPSRYLFHTLQLASSYLAQISPASTISTAATFQTSDTLRWQTHLAYRTVELSKQYPDLGLGVDERKHWEDDAAWQGFRELMEKALIVWDWGECFAVLNLVCMPTISETLLIEFAGYGQQEGDTLMSMVCSGQLRDVERHQRWTSALVETIGETEGNVDQLRAWVAKWQPLADKAIDAFCAELPDGGSAASSIKKRVNKFQKQLGVI